MAVQIEIALPGQANVDALAVLVAQPVGGEGARIVDEKLGGRLAQLADERRAAGERGEALLIHSNGDLDAPRLVAVGLGSARPWTPTRSVRPAPRQHRRSPASAARSAGCSTRACR